MIFLLDFDMAESLISVEHRIRGFTDDKKLEENIKKVQPVEGWKTITTENQ